MPTLLYHTGALGDFITTLPALEFWKKSRPGDRLVLLGKSAMGELALDAGLIDEAWDIDSSRFVPLFREDYSPAAAELLSVFDAAIAFADDSSPLLANLRRSGIAHLHSQPPFPAGSGVHVIDYHLSLFIDPATIALPDKIPRLVPSEHAYASSKELLTTGIEPVALHPGSGSPLKNWPAARFPELANHLRGRGLPILWIKGPAEASLDLPPEDYCVDEATLPILAAMLSRCRLFIGNDGGVVHMAAAAGCPVAVIFGPSDPAVWSPRGPRVVIVHKNESCSPCHLRENKAGNCGRSCLERVTIDDVLNASENLLAAKPGRE